MTRKRSKDPEEGACPQCRKLIPLVTRQGDLVLQTHHVVAAEQFKNGYDVQECGGSQKPPGELDDSRDWAWVPEPGAEPAFEDGGPVPVSEAMRGVEANMQRFREAAAVIGEAMRGAATSTREEFTLTTEQLEAVVRTSVHSEAVREATTASTIPRGLLNDRITLAPDNSQADRRRAMRKVARRMREALEPVVADITGQRQDVSVTANPDGGGGARLRGFIRPDGFQFGTWVPAHVLTDPVMLDDLIRRAVAEARSQLERRFRPRTETMTPTRVEVDGVDITNSISGPIEITYDEAPRRVAGLADVEISLPDLPMPPSTGMAALIGRVLTAVRQAFMDVTWEPPGDVDVSLEATSGFEEDGPQVLTLRFPLDDGEPFVLRVPLAPEVAEDAALSDAVARQAADTVRSRLRERCCGAEADLHSCRTAGPHETHRCVMENCGATWSGEYGTPSFQGAFL